MQTILYPNPRRVSEFEIQAEIYSRLRALGIDVRGEVKIPGCRFDLVVFNDQRQAVCIIEIKSWTPESFEKRQGKDYKTKQMNKYSAFGVPVFVCGRPECIPETIDKVVQIEAVSA